MVVFSPSSLLVILKVFSKPPDPVILYFRGDHCRAALQGSAMGCTDFYKAIDSQPAPPLVYVQGCSHGRVNHVRSQPSQFSSLLLRCSPGSSTPGNE